jgi:hypothetical protein
MSHNRIIVILIFFSNYSSLFFFFFDFSFIDLTFFFSSLFSFNLYSSLFPQHTGSAADLICETLKKANEFVYKRRINPRAKPEKPFKIDLPDNYK